MEVIRFTPNNIEEAAARAGAVLRAGGVVLYPTDTLYGLGADALSDAAVAQIYAIKGRNEDKPIHAIVSDVEMAERYGVVSAAARAFVRRFGGAVTVIVAKRAGVDSGIARAAATFGFRVSDNEFCKAMLAAFGKPVTATSANVAGMASEDSVAGILAQFEKSHIPKYMSMLQLVIDAGELPHRAASSVVDCTGVEPRVLREGAVSAVDIMKMAR